jgi:hypothetical protein
VLLLVTFLIPGSAALPGTAFVHEQMKVHHFAGMILITLGDWRSSMGELPRRQLGIWRDAAGARESQSLSVEAQERPSERIARGKAGHAERK